MYEYKAIVRKIYDADTVTLDIDLGFYTWIHSQSCRLLGINAPEVTGIEKPQGIISRDALRSWIPLGSEVTIKTYKDDSDKYGRWLVEIFYEGVNINQRLLNEGFAQEYQG